MPFFPLALGFTKFFDQAWAEIKILDEKWPKPLGFLCLIFLDFFWLFLFLLFLSFCCSDWPSTRLASWSKTSEKASSRWAIFATELPHVVARNFPPSFSLKFLSIFIHISGSTELITLVWLSLESSFLRAEIELKWYQLWSKVKASEVKERPRLVTGGTRVNGLKLRASNTKLYLDSESPSESDEDPLAFFFFFNFPFFFLFFASNFFFFFDFLLVLLSDCSGFSSRYNLVP